jgi:hypothetical protein
MVSVTACVAGAAAPALTPEKAIAGTMPANMTIANSQRVARGSLLNAFFINSFLYA